VKLFQRYYILLLLFICIPTDVYSMVVDNRYFPWFNHPYNGTDHQHGCFRADPFFITSESAWRIKPGVRQVDQETGYPNLQGTLDYNKLGQAYVLAGLENPIPADWQYVQDFPVDMPGSFQGQGIAFSGYAPISKHFGFGGTIFFLRLMATANLVPGAETTRILNLAAPGNMARFTELTRQFELMSETQDGFSNESGVSDIDIYIRGFDVREYIYFCRKFDRSVALGLLIPTGVQQSIHSVGSVPFGGNGFWGWYISPMIEIELKEDWKLGIVGRVEKRFAKTVVSRITVAEESDVFAPVIGDLYINPGTTFMLAPYFALEDIREGVGAVLQYTIIAHQSDEFIDKREVQQPAARFINMIKNSRWLSEYATVEFLYDLSFGEPWSYKPLFTLALDMPVSLVGARGSARTYRITLGLTVDF